MKLFYTLCLCLTTAFLSVEAQTVVDSVALEAGFVNDVYYSIPSHYQYPTPSDWDIALSTQPSDPPSNTVLATTIRVNGGRGVKLYKITSTDASGFGTSFSSSDSASWQLLLDSPVNWDFGGTYATHNSANPFDYGWGVYDMATHDVVGDSVYAIRTLSGIWKKLTVNKLAFDTAWFLTIADLDNNNYETPQVNKQAAAGKNFVYLNLYTSSVMDKEPAAWDMLFTRYVEMLTPQGYPVNGVLVNKGVTVAKAYPVDVNTVNYNDYSSMMTSDINTIGYNWKTFNSAANDYDVKDSLVYFVKAQNDNVYKLRFTAYRIANAEFVFALSDVNTSIDVVKNTSDILLYPNPASDLLTLIDFKAAGAQYRIADATGRTVGSGAFAPSQVQHAIDLSGMSNGMYVIQILKNNTVQTRSFVVSR